MAGRQVLFGYLFLVICAALVALGAAAQRDERDYTWIDCPVNFSELYSEYSVEIACGQLTVLEDRAAPSSTSIYLFVAVVGVTDEHSLTPLLYLAGGPGDAASSEIATWLDAGLHERRDIIFVDQRGSGLSLPSLDCPELDQPGGEESLLICRDRLQVEGIDLAAYNAESLAHDVADLIDAMQLDIVSVYAQSYGARVALQVAALVPDRIHSLVLDSAHLPGAGAIGSAAANSALALQRVFADCGADSVCAGAYPNLASMFEEAVTKLNAAPVEIEGLVPKAALRLDGAGFLRLLREMLADSRRLPYVPFFIAAAAEGDYAALLELEALSFTAGEIDAQSEGMYMSVLCTDELAYTSAENVSRAADYLPAMYTSLVRSSLELLADCANWMGALSAREQAKQTGLHTPILWLDGRYDPITSDRSLFVSAAPGWRYTDPRAGHGILLQSRCARMIALAFLSAPAAEPQHRCLLEPQSLEFYVGQDE